MSKRQKFSINKETLVREENDNFILTRVPNSEGQYFVAFSRNDVVSQDDKTYILELDEEQQIAMWNGEPHIKFAENAQTNPEYNNSAMTRLSASELYSDYYTYSDPSAKQRRQERQQKFSAKKAKSGVQNKAQDASKGEDSANAVPAEEGQNQNNNAGQKTKVTHYDARQMAEIMKGMKQGVDVDQYRNVDMDADKMKELRLGLRSGVDVSPWNNKDISARAMRELRLGARKVLEIKDIDVSKYNGEQLREIRLGLQQGLGLKVSDYLNSDYEAAQMRELRLGLRAGLDISVYQDIHFTDAQMQQLRYRLVLQNIMQILRNFLEEAKIWLSQRVENLADMLSIKIPTPEIHGLLEELPAEQSPAKQIEDILIKSEMADEAVLQSEAVHEELTKSIEDLIVTIQNGVPENIALEQSAQEMLNQAVSNLLTNVSTIIQVAQAAEQQASSVNDNNTKGQTGTPTSDSSKQEIEDPQLDKGTIEQTTEEYVEQVQMIEEAVAMEA